MSRSNVTLLGAIPFVATDMVKCTHNFIVLYTDAGVDPFTGQGLAKKSEVRAEVNETFKIKGLKKSRRDTIKHVLGGKPIGYLQSVLNLPLGSTKTYSFSSPNRGLETGSSATRSPTLTTEPRCLL